MKRHLTNVTNAFFDACKTIDNRPGTFEMCDSPWSDVPMGALVQVEDILSVCYEPWLDNKNPSVVKFGNVYFKYVLWAVSKVLHS
jgi:hypothetical protein